MFRIVRYYFYRNSDFYLETASLLILIFWVLMFIFYGDILVLIVGSKLIILLIWIIYSTIVYFRSTSLLFSLLILLIIWSIYSKLVKPTLLIFYLGWAWYLSYFAEFIFVLLIMLKSGISWQLLARETDWRESNLLVLKLKGFIYIACGVAEWYYEGYFCCFFYEV